LSSSGSSAAGSLKSAISSKRPKLPNDSYSSTGAPSAASVVIPAKTALLGE
jgi:hypothetical protein